MTIALVCKRCLASLPQPGDSSPFVACSYCGTTHTVDRPIMEIAPRAPDPSDADRRREAAEAAWDQARANSKDPVVAVRAVVTARSEQLRDEVEAERAARLAESLLTGFDAQHKTKTLLDKQAVLRMGEAAVKAVVELRSMADTQLNLPFFAANAQGPLHLMHALTRAALVDLDKLGVFQVQEAHPPAAEQPAADETPKPKRKWWPF